MAVDAEDVNPAPEEMLRSIQQLGSCEFEQLVGDVWERLGWYTRVVGMPGDRGIDVVATTAVGQKQLIQAKRYSDSNVVSSSEVEQYDSLWLEEDAVDAITIVTTGRFSNPAEEIAPELDILLVDGGDLMEILEEIDGWDILGTYFECITVRCETDSEDRSGEAEKIRWWYS